MLCDPDLCNLESIWAALLYHGDEKVGYGLIESQCSIQATVTEHLRPQDEVDVVDDLAIQYHSAILLVTLSNTLTNVFITLSVFV